MKVLAISADRDYFRLGAEISNSSWYTKTPETKSICDTLNKGDEVKITFEKDENNKKYLQTVNVIKKNPNVLQQSFNGNKFREPEQLRKDATMRSACIAMQSMVGAYQNIDDLSNAICILYKKLYEKVQ